MTAEHISGVMLDLFNTGYTEAMVNLFDEQLEFQSKFLSKYFPLMKPGEVYQPLHFFGSSRLIGMLSVLSTAIPDYFYVPKTLTVSKEGLEMFFRAHATGTVVSYAQLGDEWKATDVLSEDAVNEGESISVEYEFNLSLNTFNKIKRIGLTFWMTGKKLYENGVLVSDDHKV